MGSWSVYCSVSKIAITAGTECVLLPLQAGGRDVGYGVQHIALTTPIFGEYDDYGGIKNIVKDWSTELIEATYGIPIETFCALMLQNGSDLLDGRCGTKTVSEELRTDKVLALVSQPHMWIHRKVYDVLSKPLPSDDRMDSIDWGNAKVLEKLGFIRSGETEDKRFNERWVYQDEEVEYSLGSDGSWTQGYYGGSGEPNGFIYRYAGWKKMFPRLPGLDWFKDKNDTWAYEIYDKEKRMEKLGWIIGFKRDESMSSIFSVAGLEDTLAMILGEEANLNEDTLKYVERLRERLAIAKEAEALQSLLLNAYRKLFEVDAFCKVLAELVTIRHNLMPASMKFEPFEAYLTPQCGDHRGHQALVKVFSDVLADEMSDYESYEENEEEEEDEDQEAIPVSTQEA